MRRLRTAWEHDIAGEIHRGQGRTRDNRTARYHARAQPGIDEVLSQLKREHNDYAFNDIIHTLNTLGVCEPDADFGRPVPSIEEPYVYGYQFFKRVTEEGVDAVRILHNLPKSYSELKNPHLYGYIERVTGEK